MNSLQSIQECFLGYADFKGTLHFSKHYGNVTFECSLNILKQVVMFKKCWLDIQLKHK